MPVARVSRPEAVARGLLPAAELRSEREFTEAVLILAEMRGWMAWHQRPARTEKGWRSAGSGSKGVPDLQLARGGRDALWVELKTDAGRLGEGQPKWAAAIPKDLYRLWRPSMWPAILEELR